MKTTTGRIAVLYPTDVLKPRLVDEHYRDEAQTAAELGLHHRRVNWEALTRQNGDVVIPGPPEPTPTSILYRGWMLTSEEYGRLASLLEAKNLTLITSPAQYARGHEMWGWYLTLAAFTPRTARLESLTENGVRVVLEELDTDQVFVRDYSKSLKHDRAASIGNGRSAPDMWLTVQRFLALRETVVGTVLLREFERFTGPEIRTWWSGGEMLALTAHPDTPDTLPELVHTNNTWLPANFGAALATLDLPLVTADFVQHEQGHFRLVEIGDGQVSDLPVSVDLTAFYRRVMGAFDE